MNKCYDCGKEQRVNTPGKPLVLTYRVPDEGERGKSLDLCPECYKKRFPWKCKPVKVIQEPCYACEGTGKFPYYEGQCYKCGQSHDPADAECPDFEMSPGDDE